MGDLTLDSDMLLQEVVKLVTSGRPLNADTLTRLTEAMTHYQAKMDLVGVGINLQQMSRISHLTQLISDLENQIAGPENIGLALLESREKIALLKVLLTDFRNTVSFLSEKSSKPQISSTDTMKKVPEQSNDVSQITDSRLTSSSRTRAIAILERILSKKEKDQVIDAEEAD